jgi:hypothetical protein
MNRIQQKLQCLLAPALIGWLVINSAIVTEADPSNLSTRKSPDWLRSAVVVFIF